jgi:hypothetical protein
MCRARFGLQGLTKAGSEDRDLLRLGEFIAAGEALVELVDVVIKRTVEVKVAQLSKWIVVRRGCPKWMLVSFVKRVHIRVPWFHSRQ